MNTVCRRGKFDAAHRVLDETSQCFNLHGHEYHYTLEFSYGETEHIGFSINFSAIKQHACRWIDEKFDHAYVANPEDEPMIDACKLVHSKVYIMNLAGTKAYCKPTAEYMSKEIFYAVGDLLNGFKGSDLRLKRVTLQETMNCFVVCDRLTNREIKHLEAGLQGQLELYKKERVQ